MPAGPLSPSLLVFGGKGGEGKRLVWTSETLWVLDGPPSSPGLGQAQPQVQVKLQWHAPVRPLSTVNPLSLFLCYPRRKALPPEGWKLPPRTQSRVAPRRPPGAGGAPRCRGRRCS